MQVLLLLLSIGSGEQPDALVKRFVAAFNAHDVQAMAALVTDDISWIYLAGDDLAIEANNKEELVKAMTGYFKSIPSARSECGPALISGNFVSMEERAFWKNKQGETKSQASLAVYELKDDKIRRVWYFPAHP